MKAKKILSVIMGALMIFSCMAVPVNASGEDVAEIPFIIEMTEKTAGMLISFFAGYFNRLFGKNEAVLQIAYKF